MRSICAIDLVSVGLVLMMLLITDANGAVMSFVWRL